MRGLWAPLRRPVVQRGIRAALAAGIAWQIAVLLPAPFSDQASYAPLGAIIAVLPTVADSASAAWRTVLAILVGSGLAVAVHTLTSPIPQAITLALLVALAVVVEQWRRQAQPRPGRPRRRCHRAAGPGFLPGPVVPGRSPG